MERQRQTESQTERDRDRETETERDRQADREGQREADEEERGRETDRQTDRQAETDADVADILPNEYLYDVLTHRFRLARDTLVTLVRHQLLSHALSSVTQDNVARTQTGCRVLKLTPYDTLWSPPRTDGKRSQHSATLHLT